MDWLALSLISAAIFGAVMVLDKRLVDHVFPTVGGLNFAVAWAQLVTGALFLAVVLPRNGLPSGEAIVVSLICGVFWAGGLMAFFYGLRLTEVSRASPIWMSAPIFAAVLAATFLGERISVLQWSAIVVVVGGAALASYRPQRSGRSFISTRALVVLLGAAVLTGAAFVWNKEATELTGVWEVQGLRNLSMGAVMAAVSWRAGTLSEMVSTLRKAANFNLFFITEVVVAPAAAIIFVTAISRGPISLVGAVNSSRPLFVLLISSLLSTRLWNVLNEPLDRGTLVLKGLSALMIGAGVTTLGLV